MTPMDCRDALERLYQYLDGELTPATADEVRRHVELCQACYPGARLTREFQEAVRRAGEGQPVCPDSLREKIARMLAEEPS